MIPLLLLACHKPDPSHTDAPDTDDTDAPHTDETDAPVEPLFPLEGEWMIARQELVPPEGPDWVTWANSLGNDDFPDYIGCIGEPVDVNQGFAFDRGAEAFLYIALEARDCADDTVIVQHDIWVEYGTWSFEGRNDDGTRDVYTVDGREWTILPIGTYGRATSGTYTFSLYEADLP